MTSKGLVFDLDAENSDSTTAYDKSRYRNNGAVTAALPVEKGYYFNGSTAQIIVPNAAQLQITRSLITLIAWIKTEDNGLKCIIDKLDHIDLPIFGYGLKLNTQNLPTSPGMPSFVTNFDQYNSNVLITDNKPHFIAGVLDGINKFIVVDDKIAVTKAYATAIIDSGLNLGIGTNAVHGTNLNGRIYFAQIYNIGLNFGQLMEIYNSTKHKYI